MKQYKITAADLNQDSPDDAYLSPDDPIHEIKALAGLGGLGGVARLHEYRASQTSYGDPEWFKLWFSLPYMTGEKSHESK